MKGAMLSLTRQALSDGSASDAFRASAPPGITLFTEEQLQESLEQTLNGIAPGADVHVFAYGSLMWNPAFHFSGESIATVQGWSRKFCLRLHMARGSPERPGIMLALDRGGACRGVAYRIAWHAVRTELLLLWRREMLAGAYHAKWVNVRTEGGTFRALTFVVNRRHVRYMPRLTPDEVAHFISTGSGSLGSCQTYFETTVRTLHQLGIKDAGVERIRAALSRRL